LCQRELRCLLPALQITVQANSASGREKAALESRAAKAKAKFDAAREKAEAVERAPLPKIEVRCTENDMQGAVFVGAMPSLMIFRM